MILFASCLLNASLPFSSESTFFAQHFHSFQKSFASIFGKGLLYHLSYLKKPVEVIDVTEAAKVMHATKIMGTVEVAGAAEVMDAAKAISTAEVTSAAEVMNAANILGTSEVTGAAEVMDAARALETA